MKPDEKRKQITVVLGPTAAGKTAYSIRLAHQTPSAVISADSRQIYAGMNIGTAKPQEAWRDKAHDALAPDTVKDVDHYLFNISTPDAPLTLAAWQKFAQHAIEHIIEQGLCPIITGGTMLYIDSLVHNYSLPQVPPNLVFRSRMEQEDAADLYRMLLTKDPDAKHFIEPHHKRRIIRALEVIEATNTPFSLLRTRRPSPYTYTCIGLFPQWKQLERNIRQRARQMLSSSLIEETRALQQRYGKEIPLLKTLNYRQAAAVIAGRLTETDAMDEMVRSDLLYAKRQMAWWKHRDDITWITPKSPGAEGR